MITVNRNPEKRELAVFGLLLPVFVALVGWGFWRKSPDVAYAIWGGGGVLALAYGAMAPFRRLLYVGWMYAAFPIAWVVSHAILTAVFFLVLTPVALVLRLMGRDPLQRSPDPSLGSYWVARGKAKDVSRYFRQY